MTKQKQVTPKTLPDAGRSPTEQALLKALAGGSGATVAALAAVAGVGRSTAGKALARLEQAGRVRRRVGRHDGARRLPDRWELAKPASDTKEGAADATAASTAGGRLKPGELDGLILAFLGNHHGESLGPGAVAKALQRSSGAVGNSLNRLARAEKVRQIGERPRRYRIAA